MKKMKCYLNFFLGTSFAGDLVRSITSFLLDFSFSILKGYEIIVIINS